MPASPRIHAHGRAPDAPAPGPDVLLRRRRAVWLVLRLLVPAGLATVIGLVARWPGDEPSRAEPAVGQAFPAGTSDAEGEVRGLEVQPGCVPPRPCTGTAVVEVLDGPGARDVQQADLPSEVIAAGVEELDTPVLTRDAVAEEVVRTLVGAIALALAVPVTTAVGAFCATAAGPPAGAAVEREVAARRARVAR